MNKKIKITITSIAISTGILLMLAPTEMVAQRRRVIVRPVRHPIRTSRLYVRPGHPIRRVLPSAVIVRPARRVVVVKSPLVYMPVITWRRTTVILPSREQLAWQDSEEIDRDDGWVDSNFGIDRSGNALFLDIRGTAKLSFAEVTFGNGNVQVVDFDEQRHKAGVYKLLDFADGRHVSTVRILAKSESDETNLAMYLSK
ncbi:MAG: hypothetical protein WBD22_07410 [Pyrinomonadaceae bacterium]